mmetsp:Transcript_7173/g.20826  ORF Transcript_7173/g.20826 Transcript_7173/m.20826 type:complete len:309 (+) Transcript_7173:285-1211(+)
MSLCPHDTLHELSLRVLQVKSQRQEVVGCSVGSVDLDTTQHGNVSVSFHSASSLANNSFHHLLLGIEKGVWKLNVLVCSHQQFFPVWQQGVVYELLLGIEGLDVGGGRCLTRLGNHGSLADVAECRRCTTATGSTLGTSSTVDGTDGTERIDTDVGSKNDQARSTIGNVVGHCAETGDTSEWETGQTTHDEGFVVLLRQGFLEGTVDFVTAQRSCYHGGWSVPVSFQSLADSRHQFGVCEGTWECHVDFGLRDAHGFLSNKASGGKANSESNTSSKQGSRSGDLDECRSAESGFICRRSHGRTTKLQR